MIVSESRQQEIDAIPSVVADLESRGIKDLHRHLLFVNEQYRKFDSLDGPVGEWGLYFHLARPQLQTALNRMIYAEPDAYMASVWSGR